MKNRAYPLYDVTPIADLKDMVKVRAREIPEKIAFRYFRNKSEIVEKTYAEFDAEVDALGSFMFANGMKGRHIAVIGENSYEWLLVYFATVNGGNVSVPLDKELSADEISELLSKSDCDTVFCSYSYLDLFDGIEGVIVYSMKDLDRYIEEGKKIIEAGNREYIDYKIDIDALSMIVFTSGTTGKSKGVMMTQKNIISDINDGCRNFVLEGGIIAVLPFHHLFGLVVGMLMVFNYKQAIFINKSLKNIKRDLLEAKPQTTFFVPLFVETFYKQIWETAKSSGKDKKLRSAMKFSNFLLKIGIDMRRKLFKDVLAAFGGDIEYILCGGAKLDPMYVKEFRSWGVEILNAYGITECSPGVAVNRNYFHKDDSAGLAIPNLQLKITEDSEILIKGNTVTRGYYKDDAATSEVLIDGWYHSGDLGYLDDDGFLYVTGRKKNLIILSNGENVSPEELEFLVSKHNEVQEVIVYEENGSIAAEIFPAESYIGNNEYFNSIISEINGKLPTYKQITKIHLRDTEFPKNTSKKIIRYKIKENKENV